MSGLFISLEGTEGSGKSTQARLLVEGLQEMGLSVTRLREPGGTAIGESVRDILLAHARNPPTPLTEALLFAASRSQLIREVIRPALEAGQIVVCDRFLDSSLAYQGGGRQLGVDKVRSINAAAVDGLLPHRTFLLDASFDLGRARLAERYGNSSESDDRFESEPRAFHQRVRNTYLQLAADEPERISVIDAGADMKSVHAEIWQQTTALLEQR